LAPWDLAESWDRVGMQVGRSDQSVSKVMVALDINLQVIQEGLRKNVNGFVVHHPLIFKPVTQINLNTPIGQCLQALIKNELFLVAAHTNMDKAERGLNQFLAERFDLTGITLLEPAPPKAYKIVVFCPESVAASIRTAMSKAGAGVIENYSECSFIASGIGTYRSGSQTQPFIGKPGEFTEVAETRLEMLAAEGNLTQIIQAILANHPYEEPAFDIYPLVTPAKHGMGRIGELPSPITFQELCAKIKNDLPAREIRWVGEPDRVVRKLAICSGSGGSLIASAIKNGADAYLTGELGYHDYLFAKESGLKVITAGHWSTERCFIPLVGSFLEKYFQNSTDFKVCESNIIQEEPYQTQS
jgi:dinuclear metal center YbgI/SA1388 family protein